MFGMCTGVSPKRIATRNVFCVVPFRLFPPGGLTQQRKTLSFYFQYVLHSSTKPSGFIPGMSCTSMLDTSVLFPAFSELFIQFPLITQQ